LFSSASLCVPMRFPKGPTTPTPRPPPTFRIAPHFYAIGFAQSSTLM
jgi:hypothetical protein